MVSTHGTQGAWYYLNMVSTPGAWYFDLNGFLVQGLDLNLIT
jgi:hypothetical protein